MMINDIVYLRVILQSARDEQAVMALTDDDRKTVAEVLAVVADLLELAVPWVAVLPVSYRWIATLALSTAVGVLRKIAERMGGKE